MTVEEVKALIHRHIATCNQHIGEQQDCVKECSTMIHSRAVHESLVARYQQRKYALRSLLTEIEETEAI